MIDYNAASIGMDDSQDQNPSAHSGKYASILDGPRSHTPIKHTKPNGSKRTHNEATDGWYEGDLTTYILHYNLKGGDTRNRYRIHAGYSE